MTDRVNALIVILDKDIREDDIQLYINAIRMLKNVIDVQLNVSDMSEVIAKTRLKHELISKIIGLFK